MATWWVKATKDKVMKPGLPKRYITQTPEQVESSAYLQRCIMRGELELCEDPGEAKPKAAPKAERKRQPTGEVTEAVTGSSMRERKPKPKKGE